VACLECGTLGLALLERPTLSYQLADRRHDNNSLKNKWMDNAKKLTLVESKPDDYTYLLTPCQGFFRPFYEKVTV
jgi:hypothetical protein